ncbi:MAG: hypothetical protein J6V90_12750 [Treponema sp.]|nr:hypothetical protein [Treponema sp.]
MKNNLIVVVSLLFAIALVVPLPPLALTILFYADSTFAVSILMVCVFSLAKKRIYKVMTSLIVCFSLYTVYLDITTARFVMTMKEGQEPIAFVADFAQSGFINFPHAGYILFAIFILLSVITMIKKSNVVDERLEKALKLVRAAIEIIFIMFLVSVFAGTLFGVVKGGLGFKESFLLHLPFACAQITLFMVNFCFVGVGLNSIFFAKNYKTDYFQNK